MDEVDRLEDLQRLRGVLWDSLQEAPADKRASLARELSSTLQQIENLTPTSKAGDPVDELGERRAARRSGTASNQARAKDNQG